MKNPLIFAMVLFVSFSVSASKSKSNEGYTIQMEFCDEGVCKFISRQAHGLANNTETLLEFELDELSQQQISRLGIEDGCEQNKQCFFAATINAMFRIENYALTRFTAVTELTQMEIVRVKFGGSEMDMLKNPNTRYQRHTFFNDRNWQVIASGKDFRYRIKVEEKNQH